MKTLNIFSFAALVAVIFFASGCEEPIDDIKAPVHKVFDIELFRDNVDNTLTGEAVGYCYVISQNGQLKYSAQVGKRISGSDGSVNQSIHEPMYTASVSKAITAIAALKLMKTKNISINDKFWTYLPSHWVVPNSIKQLTFRHLLQHTSGIKGTVGFSYASLKNVIEAGVSAADVGNPDYENANFGLFRILIPYMLVDLDLTMAGEDDLINTTTAASYRSYVIGNLFTPLDIKKVDVKPIGANPTLYYSFPADAAEQGWGIGDRTLLSGGGGWYISCYDLAKFFAYVRFTEDIISNDLRDLMNDNFLGWDQGLSVSANNDHGIYHAKNGGLTNGGRGVSTLIKNFPEGVQIAVMVNSVGGDLSLNTDMRDAFDNAWVVD